jgi:hypothetical protein
MSRNSGFGLNLGLFSMILNNRSKTWKSQGLFEKDADLPEHAHAAQVGIVLEGKIELVIGGEKQCFTKGNRYYIPEGVKHSGKIYAGYADITFFNEPNRYLAK